MNMIRLENVTFSYESARVFQDLSLTITGNMSILGKSGCGKTTLLHLISGILKPDAGRVTIGGGSNAALRNRIGLVMQRGGVFPYKTVFDNMSLGILRCPDKEQRTREIADLLGLSGHLKKYPCQLSGGQLQRVALGRVLCMKPEILLLDEPFSALDEITRQQLQDEVLTISKRSRTLMVTVTHSIEEAVKLGDTVVALSHDGKIAGRFDTQRCIDRDIQFYAKCIEIRQRIEDELR
jgi:ABC-type nitrate/sulfonate/bicarbonate transport system ATPase subunit